MSDIGYLWDERKQQRVLEKHSLTLSQVVQAAEDVEHLSAPDPQGDPERFMLVGRTDAGLTLQVLCSEEDLPVVRLITAFVADEYWRREYER